MEELWQGIKDELCKPWLNSEEADEGEARVTLKYMSNWLRGLRLIIKAFLFIGESQAYL